ncbi:MAG: PilZ domain-containing protein [Methyloligellaceae bacterium]
MGGEAAETDLKQQRTAERLDLVKLGTLHVDGDKHPVKIINISYKGMKIWGLELEVNQKVTIEWRKGEKIDACVVWSIGEAAGLSFETDLEDSHPLMEMVS